MAKIPSDNMSLYNQPKCLLSVSDTTADGATPATYPFFVPQDCSGISVRVYTGATITTITADIYVQTSEDGGTTWRDCGHFAQVSASIPFAKASFMPIAVVGSVGSSYDATAYIGSVQASTLAVSRISGLPIMGTYNRIYIKYGGGAGTNSGVNIDVFATSQDASI